MTSNSTWFPGHVSVQQGKRLMILRPGRSFGIGWKNKLRMCEDEHWPDFQYQVLHFLALSFALALFLFSVVRLVF